MSSVTRTGERRRSALSAGIQRCDFADFSSTAGDGGADLITMRGDERAAAGSCARNWQTWIRSWPRRNGCARWSALSAARIRPGTTNADGPGPVTTIGLRVIDGGCGCHCEQVQRCPAERKLTHGVPGISGVGGCVTRTYFIIGANPRSKDVTQRIPAARGLALPGSLPRGPPARNQRQWRCGVEQFGISGGS
jgi:hypothetical protein